MTGRTGSPRVTRGAVPATQPNVFTAEMEQAIAFLEDARARLSIVLIDIVDASRARTAALVEALLRLGPVGMLNDGRLALLHTAPRFPGRLGDVRVERLVRRRLDEATRASPDSGRLPRFGMVHFRADGAGVITRLIDEAASTLVDRRNGAGA